MKYDNIAGLVTIYHPDDNVYENITTYSCYVGDLYVVVNSEISIELEENLRRLSNVKVINNHENNGVAKAVNIVLDMVDDNEVDWLLTMDQDSYFYDDVLDEYFSVLKEIDDKKVYGVTSLIYGNKKGGEYRYVERCITSGMILNVRIAKGVGGFDNRLFIDEVDHEFCYRCNKFGYSLIEYQSKIMHHSVGETKKYNFSFMKFSSDNEKSFRMYYIFRNSLYVMRKYPEVRKKYVVDLMKRVVKIIIVESDKRRKIIYAIKGSIDYFKNRMGRLDEIS